ncbi:MAG: polysaccharide biosynthesis tyrosine autokinase [Pseudomonadota bacterium]
MAAVPDLDARREQFARQQTDAVEQGLQRLEDDSDTRSAADYWESIKRYKWSALGVALLVAGIGLMNAYSAQSVYRADARLLVQINPASMTGLNRFDPLPLRWLFFETQQDIISSRAVAAKVVTRLALDQPAPKGDAPPKPRHPWLQRIDEWRAAIPSWRQLVPEELREPPPAPPNPAQRRESAIQKVRNGLIVEGGRDSEVILIGYQSGDAREAARVANGVAEAYIEFGLSARRSTVKETGDWLGDRLEELRSKMQASEQALREYQADEGLIDSEQRDTVLQVRFNTLAREQIEANSRRTEAQARYEQLRRARAAQTKDEALNVLMGSAVVSEAARAKASAQQRVTALADRYGDKHPKMIAARAELKRATDALTARVDKGIAAVRKEFEIAQAREAKLTRLLHELETEQRAISAKTARLAQLERNVESNRKLYETFLERSREADIADGNHLSNVRIVDYAAVPLSPFKPDRNRIIVLYALAGVVLGLVLAIVRDQLDNTFKSREDIERQLALPVLGVLPRVRGRRARQVERLLLDEPISQFAEAINDVRTSVMLSDVDRPPAVVMVASATAGEGKTTLACNLASTYALRGRTLLLETDLRCGRLGVQMQTTDGPGLTDFCAGAQTLQEVVRAVPGRENLYVLPAGQYPPNPLEVLSSKRFADAIAVFREEFEYVVIDSSPVLPVSDSIIVGHLADAVIFVVRANRTTFPTSKDGLKRLLSARIKPTGVVLQQADFRKTRRYAYDYGAYYQYNRPAGR